MDFDSIYRELLELNYNNNEQGIRESIPLIPTEVFEILNITEEEIEKGNIKSIIEKIIRCNEENIKREIHLARMMVTYSKEDLEKTEEYQEYEKCSKAIKIIYSFEPFLNVTTNQRILLRNQKKAYLHEEQRLYFLNCMRKELEENSSFKISK